MKNVIEIEGITLDVIENCTELSKLLEFKVKLLEINAFAKMNLSKCKQDFINGNCKDLYKKNKIKGFVRLSGVLLSRIQDRQRELKIINKNNKNLNKDRMLIDIFKEILSNEDFYRGVDILILRMKEL